MFDIDHCYFDKALKKAESGDSEFQCSVGYMYGFGRLTERNYEKAFYWFNESAKQNDGLGMYNLSIMYEQGFGIEIDYKKAFRWALKAFLKIKDDSTSSGYIISAVGHYFFEGKGTKKDEDIAKKWYNLLLSENVDDFNKKYEELCNHAKTILEEMDEENES